MVVDIDIKYYYKAFIDSANSDIEKYKKNLILNTTVKNKTKDYLKDKTDYIKKELDINLKDFPFNWTIGKYNEKEGLGIIAFNKLNNDITGKRRIVLLQLIKYVELLRTCLETQLNIEQAQDRSKITFHQYKEYLRKYYMQSVHKCLIDGYAYHMNYGIGDILINFWKYINGPKNNYVDWDATRQRKNKIIEAGLKLYNDEEAKQYEKSGLKYDGIPYVVYKSNKEFYNIELINNRYYKNSNIKFKHANYIPYKFRGKTVEEIANMFSSVEEIAKQDLGIRHKLISCIAKDPTLYVKYIRNAEQYKYKYGEHNTKVKQKAE